MGVTEGSGGDGQNSTVKRRVPEGVLKETKVVEEKSSSSMAPSMVIAVVIIILTGTIPTLFAPSTHNYNTIEIFKNKLREMERDFPVQHNMYWSRLQNDGIQHLIKVYRGYDSDVTPLSYLVVGYAGSKKTVDCFMSRLATTYTNSNPEDHQYIDAAKFTGGDDKVKLFEEIKLKLNGTNKLVVVKDVDKLNFEVAQLFMSFIISNNSVASYPQSILLFTTELPFSYNPSRLQNEDEDAVGNHFKSNLWREAHIDHSAQLWSKVGGGLILLREENEMPFCN